MNPSKSLIIILLLTAVAAITHSHMADNKPPNSGDSFGRSPEAVATFLDSKKVAAAFAKGMPLIENSQFKIQAGRRDAPGIAEMHAKDTDIFHVLEGSAILVTGGTAVEP